MKITKPVRFLAITLLAMGALYESELPVAGSAAMQRPSEAKHAEVSMLPQAHAGESWQTVLGAGWK